LMMGKMFRNVGNKKKNKKSGYCWKTMADEAFLLIWRPDNWNWVSGGTRWSSSPGLRESLQQYGGRKSLYIFKKWSRI